MKEVKSGTQGRNLEEGRKTVGEFCLLAGLFCLIPIAQSELAPPTSIPSQKNTQQSYLQANFMEAFTQLKLSL